MIRRLHREFVTNMLWPCLTKFCQNQDVSVSVTYLAHERFHTKYVPQSSPCDLSPFPAPGKNKNSELLKGGCQKLLSGFFPLRGGGYSPFPLRVFGQDDFPLRGRGVPPNSAKENSAETQVFYVWKLYFLPFLCIFSPFWTIIWPFWPIFNLI